MKRIYAIDFGTTNSLIASATESDVDAPLALDQNASDPTVLRSLIYFANAKEVFFGQEAIHEFSERDFEGRFLKSMKRFLPEKKFVGTYVGNRPFNLENLIALFLMRMKRVADEHYGENVTSVVLGRPARYALDDEQDRFAEYRMERAAREAGFEEVYFCPEPVAAALEAGTDTMSGEGHERIAVIADFGGGTSDFTVVRLRPEGYTSEDVLSMTGVPMAGDVLDSRLMRTQVAPYFGSESHYKRPFGSNELRFPTYFTEKFCSPAELMLLKERENIEFLKEVTRFGVTESDRAAFERLLTVVEDQLGFELLETVEHLKRELSSHAEAELIYQYPTIDLKMHVSREAFEKAVERQVDKILDAADRAVLDAGLGMHEVDVVYVTGGTGQVPFIRQGLAERFGEDRIVFRKTLHSVIGGLARAGQRVLTSGAPF